jgi:hypothetical protein
MSSQSESRADYLSYLMRLCRTQCGDGRVWRVSLEEPLTQQVYRFEDLPGLFAFLLAQTAQGTQGGGPDGHIPPTIIP